jgi:hypothetical protein
MKIKAFTLQVFIATTFFVLAGCVPEISMTLRPNQTTTPSFIISPSSTASPKPTLVFPPSLTPVPNMQSDKIPQLIAALQDDACKLPCYLGIVPGKTTLQEGIAILENLGGIYTGSYQRESDGALSYNFKFYIGDDATLPKGRIVEHSVTLMTDKDIVQIVDVIASPIIYESREPATTTYQTYWKRYSLREIFLQMGEPENIYLNPKDRPSESGTQWFLVYVKQSIQIDLYDSWLENKLCPNETVMPLGMTLSYPGSPFSIYADGRVPPTDREIYLPIEAMFGITTNDFYNQIFADPSICFEPKVTNP